MSGVVHGFLDLVVAVAGFHAVSSHGGSLMMADRVFAPAEAKGGIPIHNSRTALLFIEYQNEFTSEGGKLHSAVRPCMMQNNMLEKSAAIMNEGRARGVKIFHVPISFKTDASDNPNRNLGILAGCAADSLFTENTWNAAFHPSMQPDPSDIVIKGKKGLDAFPGTDLEAQLKAHGIETVALAGFLTNCCVESTMRTAYEKGFNVVTLVDATATTSVEGQAVTSGSYGMFSQPMTVAEFSRQISVAPTGPMSSSRESHGGKGFGGGEATRDHAPTYKDQHDPKGKQQAIHKAESSAEYLAKRTA